ncbi:hypothetical protein ACJX0J_017813 [Zea mays]
MKKAEPNRPIIDFIIVAQAEEGYCLKKITSAIIVHIKLITGLFPFALLTRRLTSFCFAHHAFLELPYQKTGLNQSHIRHPIFQSYGTHVQPNTAYVGGTWGNLHNWIESDELYTQTRIRYIKWMKINAIYLCCTFV